MTAFKRRKSQYVLTMVTLFWMLAMILPVLAEGDGSGGGQNVSLGLATSTPADGAQNVALDTKIKLVFNKNVINMTVKENNLRCFSLYAGSAAVPINIQMADDQIYPELKREVTLVPRQALQAGTDYTVVISGALQAKSGAVLGQDIKVRFSTAAAQGEKPPAAEAGEKPAAQPPATVKQESTPQSDTQTAIVNGEKAAAPAETVKPQVKSKKSDKNQSESINKNKVDSSTAGKQTSWVWPVLIVTVIVLGAGYGYLRKKR